MPNKKPDPEGGLYMSPKSLMEIGKPIMNNGKHMGKRIISKKYFEMMIKNNIPRGSKSFFNYGFQWWSKGDYVLGWGYMGQYLAINRKKRIVGVMFQRGKGYDMIQPYDFLNIMDRF